MARALLDVIVAPAHLTAFPAVDEADTRSFLTDTICDDFMIFLFHYS